jgi:hypothetical protein
VNARVVFGVAGLVVALTGCKTAGFSALQSVNPVMLGPVPSLGSGPAYGPPSRAFTSTSKDYSDLIIGISKDDNTTTTTVNGSFASSSPNQGDLDVLVATDGNPAQRVTANRIGCGGFDFNVFFLYYISNSWCETNGNVYGPGAPQGPTAPPPAPQGATSLQGGGAPSASPAVR